MHLYLSYLLSVSYTSPAISLVLVAKLGSDTLDV